MKRRVWVSYVVTVPDAEDDAAAREIALEQVRLDWGAPDGVEIERVNETKQHKAWKVCNAR